MKLELHEVSVAGPHEPLVLPTTFTARPGAVTVVTGDPGASLTALALAIGGRVPLRQGQVSLWGCSGRAYLQEHVTLVDVEDVTAPEAALQVRDVLREQLALTRRPARGRDVKALLDRHEISDPHRRWDSLPAAVRTEVLLDLATRRPATQVIVLVNPDRHGGDARDWYAAAVAAAAEVFTVVILCTAESATHIGAPRPVAMGNATRTAIGTALEVVR